MPMQKILIQGIKEIEDESREKSTKYGTYYEDDNSAVFKFGNTLINLLKTTEGQELDAEPKA